MSDEGRMVHNRWLDLYRSYSVKGPLWVWILVTALLLASVAYLRLVAFPDRFVPLAASLTLLICLLHRNLWLLWSMVAALALMVFYKLSFVVQEYPDNSELLHGSMQLLNSVVAAVVIHVVIRLTARLESAIVELEQSNAELEASNEELAAREEEITQQNEELQTQSEELEQQTEELNAQTEELQIVNEQLAERERALADLLAFTAGGASEGETLGKLGETIERLMSYRAAAAAILEKQGDDLIVRPLFGVLEGGQLLPQKRTLADLVMSRRQAASLADVALRDDLVVPQLMNGSSVKSLAAAPLQVGDDAEGALEVYSTDTGEWTSHERRLVQWLANQCGRMMMTARLKDDLERLIHAEHRAREEAERANRAKDEFVATLSHELRTPLTAVLGWSSLLRKSRCENRDETLKGLEVIERNARHQAQLISDLLDMSRILAGKISLDVEALELPDVIDNAIESVRLAAEAKGVSLVREVEPIDRAIVGDANRLQQVVWNLLTNGIKFTPRGGRVCISVSRPGSYVQISVSDTGEGIDPKLLPQLFQRYRQADSSATRRHGGLGLGLAIVKNLVELHGGTVHATSDGLGNGATFAVRLPIRATMPFERSGGQSISAAMAGALDGQTLSGSTILIVDDEEDARDLISRMLSGCGADVHVAGSAEEALSIAQQVLPDVLISDIGMPGVDGYEFIKQLRQQWPVEKPQPPAIALTAFARSEERTRAFVAGFQAHLAKPVEAAELIATIRSLLFTMGRSVESRTSQGAQD